MTKRSSNSLQAFMSAALALPGLGIANEAKAQSMPDAAMVRVQYADYRDYQGGDFEGRMRVKTPSIWAQVPVAERTLIEGSTTYDSMAGASPYFLNSLTGASGFGVDDIRRQGDLKITQYFERFSIGLGGAISDEDDYLSRNGNLEARIWSEDKNTTYAFGAGFTSDDITSSIDDTLDEERKTGDFFLGITQVLDQRSIIQSNITYSSADGYLTDPYKSLDNRPESRDRYAWLTRYRRYYPESQGALHADYRFYFDSWDVTSHTLEVAWYQPFGDHWMIRPNLRYVSQSAADFFEGVFPDALPERNFSMDQRLGDFGGYTVGVRLDRELGSGFSANIQAQFMEQRPSLKLGSYQSSREIEPFYATMVLVGVAKKF